MTGNVVNDNSAVYYSGHYWNDLEAVRHVLNRRVSGDPERTWSEHFAERVGRTFKRALILNCGNGHVERGLVAQGLISEAIGIDYSDALLDEARAAAAEAGLPLRYHQMDVNTVAFPDEPFDLVVNFAAAHHIACIDRVFRRLCELLPDDGWFVAWDYVGPHRNQYTYEAWDAAWRLNEQLPESVRQDMRYPHLPTMLATDPTEAIHAELIEETFRRYYQVDEWIPLGGAIAYPLLTHNDALFSVDDAERDPHVATILEADARFLEAHPSSSLFAYFAGQPDKAALADDERLARWRAEEDAREAAATADGGEYYPHSALQDLMLALEGQRIATEHARTDLDAARADLDAAAAELTEARRFVAHPYVASARRTLGKAAATPTGQRLQANPKVAGAADRLRRRLP